MHAAAKHAARSETLAAPVAEARGLIEQARAAEAERARAAAEAAAAAVAAGSDRTTSRRLSCETAVERQVEWVWARARAAVAEAEAGTGVGSVRSGQGRREKAVLGFRVGRGGASMVGVGIRIAPPRVTRVAT
jgi:septal ring factor EnvC (AmiA/AmiB activator)